MPELRLENSLVDERYEVHERLGLGSYAEIWVARDHLAGGREVVLKALNTSLQGTPDADLERTLVENFQNEAIALDTVRHPHVILRLGHGTAADLRGVPFHYLVLEYMAGGDLLRLCRRQPGNRLGLEQALFFFKQACEALAYAHNQGIIHRDLKPNNLLVSAEQKTLKVADFGVAKLSSGEATEITRVGAGLYAPPEHHPDEVESNGKVERLTAAADIYSLAKSVYTVVCGRAPSQFACQTVTSLPAEVQSQAWANVLLNVLKRATALDPKDRYATVTEFWSDLANVAVLNDASEEETQVRPRLSVSKFDVPTMPPQPAFDPVLASSGAQPKAIAVAEPLATVAEPLSPQIAVPVPAQAKPPSNLPHPNGFGSKPKIVVDLQPKAPPIAVQPVSDAPQKSQIAVKAPGQTPVNKGEQRRAARFEVKEKFTEGRRSLIFGGLLAVAFLGFLLTLYHTVRNNGLPVGFGEPSRIEITIEKLNVRNGPSPQAAVLGVIGKGSRHRVLSETEQGWMQIEVNQWDESEPHVSDQKQGWVAGTARNVKVIGRRAW
jgi:eukaryotic-like serine/threonine-protein kinase